MSKLAGVAILCFFVGLADGARAEAPVTLAPGFGAKTATVATTAPSGAQPTTWATGKNGTEYLGGAPAFTLEVTTRVEVAFRIASQKGSVVQGYLSAPVLKKLWDIALETENDRKDPNIRHFASAWQDAVLTPGRYEIYFSHHYAGHATEAATLELIDLTPRPASLAPGFAVAAGELHDLRSQPWSSEARIATEQIATRFIAIEGGPCAGAFRPDAPMAVVEVKGALGATRIALARGSAGGIYVEHASGWSSCSVPQATGPNGYLEAFIDAPSLPAGALSVWVVRPSEGGPSRPEHPNGDTFFDVTFEDLTHPRAVAWTDATPHWTLDGPLPEALNVRATTTERGAPRPSCPRLVGASGRRGPEWLAAERADVVVSVKRPVEGMQLKLATAAASGVSLEGPFGPDGRALSGQETPEQCLFTSAMGTLKLPRLEPGNYIVRVALTPDDTGATLVLASEKSKRDPLLLTFNPPAIQTASQPGSQNGLKLPRRLLGLYFAMWPDVSDSAEFGQFPGAPRFAMFMTAPLGLFVVPTFDLDGASARLDSGRQVTDDPKEVTEFPRKDEPLLMLGISGESGESETRLMAADGGVWAVKLRYLASAGGALVVPKAARNVSITWESVDRVAAPEDAPKIAKVNALLDKEDACYDKALDGKAEYVVVTRTRGGSTYDRRVYSDADLERARRVCNFGGEKARDKLVTEIETTYRKRVAAELAKIAAHLAH